MKIFDVEQRSPEWKELRRGCVTGTKLKDIYIALTKTQECAKLLYEGTEEADAMESVGCTKATITAAKKALATGGKSAFTITDKKIGFYQLVADRVATEEDGDETPMHRGTRLEEEALGAFNEMKGKKLGVVGFCTREDNPRVTNSPDALSDDMKEGGEIKCLSSAQHLMYYFERKVPAEYYPQVVQNFIVNDKLERLYFIFYDPRITAKPLHYITVYRTDIEKDIVKFREYQEQELKDVDARVAELTF